MPNKMERFTQRARRVLSLAQEEAERRQDSYIGTEHILIGLIREDSGVAHRVLTDLGLNERLIIEVVERLTHAGTRTQETKFELSPGTRKILEIAVDEARAMGHHLIGTEHLLLALVRQTDNVAIEVLKRLNVSPEEVRRQTRRVLKETTPVSKPITRASPVRTPKQEAAPQEPLSAKAIAEQLMAMAIKQPTVFWRAGWDYLIANVNTEAHRLKQTEIRPENLLLGLLMDKGEGDPAESILWQAGLRVNDVKALVEQMASEQPLQEEVNIIISDEMANIPIETLELNTGVFNALQNLGIRTVGIALEVLEEMTKENLALWSFGSRSIYELVRQLKNKGYLPRSSRYYPLEFSPDLIHIFGIAVAETLYNLKSKVENATLLIAIVKHGNNKAVEIMKQLDVSPESVEKAACESLNRL